MMRLFASVAATLVALLALAAAPASAALPEPSTLRLLNLTVNDHSGLTSPWYADSSIRLAWELTPELTADPAPIADFGYAVFYPGRGDPVRTDTVDATARSVTFGLPAFAGGGSPPPGTYTVAVWVNGHDLVPGENRAGPAATAAIPFDDRRPSAVAPQLGAEWFRGDAEPVLRISRPGEPRPVSGIRGYAFALRRDTAAPPCAGPDRCSAAETDLDGGAEDDTLALGRLPEGRYALSAVAVSNAGMRSAQAGTVGFGIDATLPDVVLAGTGGGWANGPVRVVARASDALSGMTAAGPTGPRTTLAIDAGDPAVAAGDEVAATVSGNGVHSVAAGARDAVGNVRGEDGSAPVTGLVRIDEAPPTVAFAAASDPADPERIEATVVDSLSGPAARGSIAVRPLGSGQPFAPLPTQAEAGRLVAHWDSDAYPEGSYEFQATGYDLAGNVASASRRPSGAAMILLNPVKARTALRFGFGGRRLVWHRCVRRGEGRRCRREVIESFARRPASRLVPYGQGLQVSGRLLNAAGGPLAGATVELVEELDPGAETRSRVTRLQTDSDGAYFARLAPGPSRRVEARFAGTRVLTRVASRSLRLGVQTLVRLRASTGLAEVGGGPVIFSGRVGAREATIPAYGRPVHFQFRLPGTPWTEFRTVQTDAHGRFRFPYAFTDDDSSGVRFLFRAYAPPQPGWPYEPAVSRPVAVTGG